jgi:hypothetical protein
MKAIVLTLLVALSLQANAKSAKTEAPPPVDSPEAAKQPGLTNWQMNDLDLHITPVVGASIMKLAGDSSTGSSNTDTGLSIGAFVEFGGGLVTFQTGLLFNQFGGKGTDSDNSGANYTVTIDYLNIPLLAKFNVMGNPLETFFFKIGLMPGFVLSKDASETLNGVSISGEASGVKSFDLPLLAGIGGTIPIAPNVSINLEGNFIYSLTSVTSSGTIRNQGFQILAGATFGL